MRIGLPISVTDRSQITKPPQTLKSLGGERLGAICLPSFRFCTISTISPAFFRSRTTPESKPGRFAPVIVLIAEEGNPLQRGSSGLTKGKPIDNYFPFSSVADPLQSPDHRMERRPTPLSLGGRDFVRADFRIKKKGGDIWEAWFGTFAKGYFLRLEIGAGSREELDGLAESTKSLSFSSQHE